jgi:hypothetical protein
VKRIAAGLLLGLIGLAACGQIDRLRRGGGQIEVRWGGADTGTISGPATAEWCGVLRLLEIRAVRGDTGVALAVYPQETLAAGRYAIKDPVKAESLPPAAGLALRWAAQTSIRGFQGEGGWVVLERSPSGELSGTLAGVARSVADTSRRTVFGTFRNLTVRPQTRGCVRPVHDTIRDAPPGDTLVH